ncbi:lysophospholipid acyltransferase family protein [Agrobacterium tumefaciens]|uniref:lysophospholipid acyltransferase family protein n=2 Tax=Agrobacterium TaxID=357 RepID=UPI000557B129|nr:lysophospholipid acyltransferase family protein [Agrobacterium tumefaciens]
MGGRASLLQIVSGSVLAVLARGVTGVRPIWAGSAPNGRQRIYYANHASHGDFILVSTCLIPAERSRTAAVAGADYWSSGRVRQFISRRLLRTVLVERNWVERTADPMQVMLNALDAGQSLIFFPEGTRNMTEQPLLRFRSGLYNLAVARPDVELVPCWIENMSRVLPKGALLPIPLLCRVVFGAPVALDEGEDRKDFLDRARQALLTLAPRKDGNSR